jgi:hypothetical protein
MEGTEVHIRLTASIIHTARVIPIHPPVREIPMAPVSAFMGMMTIDDLQGRALLMKVHGAPFASTILLLIACALCPKVAVAQYTMAQCISVTNQITQALRERSFKKLISLSRQSLTYCKEHQQRDEYVGDLSILALALNADNQPGDALGVANRCLAINANDLTCLLEKANALTALGRVSEAKSIADSALTLGAITDLDAAAKGSLQKLELRLSALTRSAVPFSPLPPNQNTSSGAELPLKKDGGTFVVPVQINGAITLNFTIDSGAADVSVPADVFSTLTRTGTIS